MWQGPAAEGGGVGEGRVTRATHLRGRAAAAHGVRWSLPRGCLLGIHSPRLPRPGRRRGAGRTEGGTEEAAGTAGPGQTSAPAPQTPPRRPLILLLPADARGRAGPGGGGAWWGRGQSTAARGVPARPAAPPPRRGRFRRGDGGGGAAPQELAELWARPSLTTRPAARCAPRWGQLCVETKL